MMWQRPSLATSIPVVKSSICAAADNGYIAAGAAFDDLDVEVAGAYGDVFGAELGGG